MKKYNKSKSAVVTDSTFETISNEAQMGYGQLFLQLKLM
jgi:hypothetical protein